MHPSPWRIPGLLPYPSTYADTVNDPVVASSPSPSSTTTTTTTTIPLLQPSPPSSSRDAGLARHAALIHRGGSSQPADPDFEFDLELEEYPNDAASRQHRNEAKREAKKRWLDEQDDMKFSHSVQFNAVPDWSSHYIAYSNLKKLSVLPISLPFFSALVPLISLYYIAIPPTDLCSIASTSWKRRYINPVSQMSRPGPSFERKTPRPSSRGR
ncbi:hypothetical protein NPX13_g8547 [Xylaria arbuscula]|uniref:SPX domain-containing protein n=1 Tax=Xylaria arbuscula TaxID=114810 RepID=A0A9W8N882_9PEZI|nr:hypothetical protein NPX13_g8547 [Xylaria arbuscula]